MHHIRYLKKSELDQFMSITHKPFYFIRHGQTDWNKEHIMQGQTDIPLNEQGIMEANNAAELLKDISFASIAVSPLSRALKTAEIIAEKISVPITIIENLKEGSWGIWEGKPKDDGTWIRLWKEGHSVEGAEEYVLFRKRVLAGVNQALELPGPVLIVAHAGMYRPIRDALKTPLLEVRNCVPFYHHPPQHPNYQWMVGDLSEQIL